MIAENQIHTMDCLRALTELDHESVDVVLTDPPYPNRQGLFTESIADGYAALYASCKRVKHYVIFFWSSTAIPPPPPGWYEVARHVWSKPDCRSKTHYEHIIVWSKDYKRQPSKVWTVPILDYRTLRDWHPHPTQKPVRLLRNLLELYTKEGDLVLDPFIGSGTTAVACQIMKRRFIGIEANPEYAKIANDRLQQQKTIKDFEQPSATEAPEQAPESTPPTKKEAVRKLFEKERLAQRRKA